MKSRISRSLLFVISFFGALAALPDYGQCEDRPVYIKSFPKDPLPFRADLDVPPGVIDAVRAAPTRLGYSISGDIETSEQIIKVKILTINADSKLVFTNLDQEKSGLPFVAIAADQVFIEIAQDRNHSAIITRPPDSRFGVNGLTPSKAANGIDHSAESSGAAGGPGGMGANGGAGRTVKLVPIYFLFNQISFSGTLPSGGTPLRFLLDGVFGGRGGDGGEGGNGGGGATGTSSNCRNFAGSCYECVAGPGVGGDGGQAGSGGRGGDAARGGPGADVWVLGPNFDKAGYIEVQHFGGNPGTPGQAGAPGRPGHEGGGGSKCCCCNGRDPGRPGAAAVPLTYGPGAPNTDRGEKGTYSPVVRNNSDLFS